MCYINVKCYIIINRGQRRYEREQRGRGDREKREVMTYFYVFIIYLINIRNRVSILKIPSSHLNIIVVS